MTLINFFFLKNLKEEEWDREERDVIFMYSRYPLCSGPVCKNKKIKIKEEKLKVEGRKRDEKNEV